MTNEPQCYLWTPQQIFRSTALLEDCSHGTIATEILFLTANGCIGFSVIVAIALCEHLH